MVRMVCYDRHVLADKLLDVPQEFRLIVTVAERNGDAGCAGAACPPDAVNIGLGDVRQLEVEDVADFLDIDTAGGDVCGHEDPDAAGTEPLHGAVALGLAFVAVDGFALDSLLVEVLDDLVGAMFGPGKNERRRHFRQGKHVREQHTLVVLRHEVHALVDEFGGRGNGRHFDTHRVAQDGAGKRQDGRRHRRREK